MLSVGIVPGLSCIMDVYAPGVGDIDSGGAWVLRGSSG